MSSFDRRALILSAVALAGCGFTPAYGPQGSAQALQNALNITVTPLERGGYLLVRRLEERLGRGARYDLAVTVDVRSEALGTDASGTNTRTQLVGRASYALRLPGDAAALIEGETDAFTGYSTTGSTVATRAAGRDAELRLMVILADQITERLILDAAALPGG